jgi:hypothetical protein
MNDAEYYRLHARHARKLAELTREPDLRRAYETIAREFERALAELEMEDATR